MYDINYDIIYDIIGQCSIRSNAAFGRPCRGRASLRRYNMHYDNLNRKNKAPHMMMRAVQGLET